eukprot:TRINITY_DN31931_c0_g1_i1.p1 TRINITY_DN31931_c0_g1~~TRINITY_DN31931_c0_g1_i1.p1  ORF type:complete len:563 (+),score=83.95 TRINITY_DN31931_c0_g1_i1:92-1780(+)
MQRCAILVLLVSQSVAESFPTDGILGKVEQLNATAAAESLKINGGPYRGKHQLLLKQTYLTSEDAREKVLHWQVSIKTHRFLHPLVDSKNQGRLVLPGRMARSENTTGLETILDFADAALKSRWNWIRKQMDMDDFCSVFKIWLVADSALLLRLCSSKTSRLATVNVDRKSRADNIVGIAFQALTRSLEGCYPGIEKITACANLNALIPVRIRTALDYRPRPGGPLHKLLQYGSRAWHRPWFNPGFWALLQRRRSKLGKQQDAEMNGSERQQGFIRKVGPGIFLFRMLDSKVAARLALDLRHFRNWALAQDLPTVKSGNQYITVLDELGGEEFLNADFLERFVAPLAKKLLGEDRITNVTSRDCKATVSAADHNLTESGLRLDRLYAFARHYAAATQTDLQDGVHHDEADVTLNIALSPKGSFSGGHLAFCGIFGKDDYRKHVLTLDWTSLIPGTAVLHSGLRRHAAWPLCHGERMNLIIWALSNSPEGVFSGPWETKFDPDAQCLSELYDSDFRRHKHLFAKGLPWLREADRCRGAAAKALESMLSHDSTVKVAPDIDEDS